MKHHSALFTITAGLVSGLLSINANAVPITGEVLFSGNATVVEVADQVTVTFLTPSIAQGTGDYLPLDPANGSPIPLFANIVFNDATDTLILPLNPLPLFSMIDGGLLYSFTLTSLITADYSSAFLNVSALSFVASGYADITGFDRTFGTFSIGGSSLNTSLRFTATAAASGVAVPDSGATAALLGISLLGVGLMGRKFGMA
jgi:hypothetical protein